MDGNRSAWCELSESEAEASKRFALDCQGLDDAAVEQVRRDFLAAGFDALRQLAGRLQRVPTQEEADAVRAGLVAHFNQHVIPALHAQSTLH